MRQQIRHELPNYDNVLGLAREAAANLDSPVELPFTWDGGMGAYALSVIAHKHGEPDWTLSFISGPQSEIVWQYRTGDLALIVNLVHSECKGSAQETLPDAATYTNLPHLAKALDNERSKELRQSMTRIQAMAMEQKDSRDLTSERKGGVTLEGDLEDIQAPSLLQSIKMTKMTGRLLLSNKLERVELYFIDGSPVHVNALENKGDDALIDIIMWEEGTFQFFPLERTAERTVTKPLDQLLMEGVTTLDQYRSLQKSGLMMDSYLLRKFPWLTEEQFEKAVSGGLPVDLSVQKRLYKQIDHKSTLFDILRRKPLSRSQWVPILFNLLSCDLIVISDKPTRAAKRSTLEVVGIDQSAIHAALNQLTRPETGLLSYPLFLYFLDQEYARFERTGLPFSAVVFEVKKRTENGGLEPLSTRGIKTLSHRLNSIKRPFDLIGHYQTFDYAAMLPFCDVAGASMVAQRMAQMIFKESIDGEQPDQLAIAFGIACIPEDCREVPVLLSAALEAKTKARETGTPIMAFSSLCVKM